MASNCWNNLMFPWKQNFDNLLQNFGFVYPVLIILDLIWTVFCGFGRISRNPRWRLSWINDIIALYHFATLRALKERVLDILFTTQFHCHNALEDTKGTDAILTPGHFLPMYRFQLSSDFAYLSESVEVFKSTKTYVLWTKIWSYSIKVLSFSFLSICSKYNTEFRFWT